ncbi:MAG: toll/interleukin-1 receptor domain-containing protein [Bacteroidales bacterium]
MDKKVFISYARSVDDTHMNWVKDLGARLMADSIDVELDQWSLKDGHDINVFMETMVNSPNISRVLIM